MHKKLLFFGTLSIAGLLVVLFMFGGRDELQRTPSPYQDHPNLYPKYSGNPLFTLGIGSDPAVVFDDGTYHLWHSCNDGEKSQICYAASNNGINWVPHPEPVLRVGHKGSWDDYNSEVPTVIKEGSLFKMWYAGYSYAEPDKYHIGYATSPDGIQWTRLSANDSPYGKEGLVLMYDNAREGEFNTIADPTVVKVNDTYHLWYDGFGTNMIAISHAISKDGIHWERNPKNPVLTPSKPWEMVGVEGTVTQPHVLWDGTKFHMWYGSFGDEFAMYTAIAHATSPDGTLWTKDDAPVLVPGPENIWAGMSAIRVGNETRLFYVCVEKPGATTKLCVATNSSN